MLLYKRAIFHINYMFLSQHMDTCNNTTAGLLHTQFWKILQGFSTVASTCVRHIGESTLPYISIVSDLYFAYTQ